jgi:Protein of unknown function (DUF1275)
MSNRNVLGRLFIHGEQPNHRKGHTLRPARNDGGHWLVDAVSLPSLGHVFTANMTGNIVFLAFATAHVSGLSIARSLTALLAFL